MDEIGMVTGKWTGHENKASASNGDDGNGCQRGARPRNGGIVERRLRGRADELCRRRAPDLQGPMHRLSSAGGTGIRKEWPRSDELPGRDEGYEARPDGHCP